MSEPLTLIGAGLVGSLLAVMLARRGYEVVIYEGRPDPRRATSRAGRSINLALSSRALHALEAQGLAAQVLQLAMPIRGRMIHPLSGAPAFLRYGRDDRECINSISRAALNQLLISAAEATSRVQLRFQQRLLHYSLATRRAVFDDLARGTTETAEASVIFGTDGCGSALRSALQESAGVQVTQERLDCGYKELTISALGSGQGLGAGGRFALDPSALHIWPRGSFMLIALPNPDGSFTCTLFLPVQSCRAAPSFAELTDAAATTAFFRRYFPDAIPLLRDFPASFLQTPISCMDTIRTWPWSQGSALLLGDAAHAIVPFFGQGMNAGFEDCTLLEQALGRQPPGAAPDWARLFAEFAADRRPDTDAIADMALENYVEMRDKVLDGRYLLKRAVEAELDLRYPGEYRSRYQLVTFTRTAYRLAAAIGRMQDQLLDEACAGVEHAGQVDYTWTRAQLVQRLGGLLGSHPEGHLAIREGRGQ